MQGQIRQGDVLLIPVNIEGSYASPPSSLAARLNRMVRGVLFDGFSRLKAPTQQRRQEVVLAYGEITGHAHRLTAPEILEWSVSGQRYVRVIGDEPGALSHEDHDPEPALVVAPNVTYQVVQQQEWDISTEWDQQQRKLAAEEEKRRWRQVSD
jgi:hypothetical protein